jgi:serine O-acetyltransferase
MFQALKEQVEAIRRLDPAARNALEIVLLYPGFHAILLHRVAHALSIRNVPFLPRLISHFGRMLTGIEIHPRAKIGRRLFIDHGMGVVIGETAEIGDDVLIYQGVTLGGTGGKTGRRHPRICNHVVIGSGACVLGNIVIEEHVKIGAGSVIISPAPAHSTAVGIPGRVVRRPNLTNNGRLRHGDLPDVVGQAIQDLKRRLEQLETCVINSAEPPTGAVPSADATLEVVNAK